MLSVAITIVLLVICVWKNTTGVFENILPWCYVWIHRSSSNTILTSQNVVTPCISFLCSTYRIICKPYHHHDTEENQHITHITKHGRKNEHFTVYLVQVSINNKGSTQLSFLCLLLLSQQLILHQFSCLVCSVLVSLFSNMATACACL